MLTCLLIVALNYSPFLFSFNFPMQKITCRQVKKDEFTFLREQQTIAISLKIQRRKKANCKRKKP